MDKPARRRRLSLLKPQSISLPPLISTHTDDYGHRDESWRAWYKSARWQRLRWEILTRDRFRCRVTGAILSGQHPAPNSPVVDHIIPHRGDERLFWDPANLQTISKAYHDGLKQSQERRVQN